MKRQSLTLSFLLFSTALVQAQSDAERAFQASVDDINRSGLATMQVGSTHYQSDADQLTAQNIVYELDWAVPKAKSGAEGSPVETGLSIKATVKIPTLVANGLSLKDGGISYDALTYVGTSIKVSFGDGSDDEMVMNAKSVGNQRVVNGFQPFVGEFKIAPSRPIGSVLDYLRPLITKPKYEKFTSDGFTITQNAPNGAVFQTDTWGPMTFSGLANGKIDLMVLAYRKGEMSLDEAIKNTMEGKDKPEGQAKTEKLPEGFPSKLTYEVGESRYLGYDFAAMMSVIDPAMPALEGITTLIKQIDIGEIKANLPGIVDLKMAPSVSKDYTIKQPASYLLPLVDDMLAQNADPENLSPSEQEKLTKAGFDLVRSFAIGLNQTGQIKADITIPDGPYKGQTAKATLDQTRLANIDSNGIEEMSLSGLSYVGPPSIDFSVGRFAIEDLEFPEYVNIEKVIKDSMKGGEPTPRQVAQLMPNALNLVFSDLNFKDDKANAITAKEIRTELDREGLTVPARLSTKIDNLTLSKSMIQHPLASVLLSQLGLEKVTLNEEITIAWDENSETFKLDPLNIELANIIKLSGSIGFGGIMRAYMDDPEHAEAIMATGTVLPSFLTLTDLGGVPDLINLAGGMTGMGPDQVRGFAQGQVQAMLSAFTKPEFASMVAEQVKIFLTAPKSLHLALQPGAPVPVAQILGVAATAPDNIPDILNIGVRANDK